MSRWDFFNHLQNGSSIQFELRLVCTEALFKKSWEICPLDKPGIQTSIITLSLDKSTRTAKLHGLLFPSSVSARTKRGLKKVKKQPNRASCRGPYVNVFIKNHNWVGRASAAWEMTMLDLSLKACQGNLHIRMIFLSTVTQIFLFL